MYPVRHDAKQMSKMQEWKGYLSGIASGTIIALALKVEVFVDEVNELLYVLVGGTYLAIRDSVLRHKSLLTAECRRSPKVRSEAPTLSHLSENLDIADSPNALEGSQHAWIWGDGHGPCWCR